jgi:hypothetical protein
MPRTTLPRFDIGEIAKIFTGICSHMPPPAARGRGASDTTAAAPAGRGRGGPPPSPLQQCVTRVGQPVGAQQTSAPDSVRILSNVDALYRISLGFDSPATWRTDAATGWIAETYRDVVRLASYATADGKRGAFVRVPSRKATIIILTNDASADVKGMANRILDRLLAQQ